MDILVIIKPDAVQRNLIGEIISRFEKANFKIKNIIMTQLTKQKAEEFYVEHYRKHFYNKLIEFMISGPIVVLIVESIGDHPKRFRRLVGETDPEMSQPGTIRFDYALNNITTSNIIHASDCKRAAEIEIEFFFGK